MSNSRRHFHTFDALRFFSFLLVFFHHIPLPESSFFSAFTHSGGVGVAFFFVLSGFLITYILLYEKSQKGRISLKRFYMRRILRIWPLYYAMILFAFLTPYILNLAHFSYSDEGYKPNWLMSVLFLENYKMMITDNFPNVSPLRVMWSLCIEEHFYIVWGLAISFIKIKKVPVLIIASLILASISRLIYSYFGIGTADLFTNIDYFAFGAIPAYILFFRNDLLKKVELIPMAIKYLTIVITLTLVFLIPNLDAGWLTFVSPIVFGLLFAALILFTLTEKNAIKAGDKLWVSKLGIYTYGLYLVHTIVINLFLQIKQLVSFNIDWISFTLITLALTILVSMLSYHLFEKQFLKLKRYFY